MSLYAVDKALWQIARDHVACAEYRADPIAYLSGRELAADEHDELLQMDYAALLARGAHPFLLYTCRIRLSDGWTYQLMIDHIKAFEGLTPPLDIAT
jgi:hypothetical protein